MPARRAAAVLLTCAAVLAVTGCGTASSSSSSASADDFSGQAKAVVTTLKDFSDAGSKRDYDALCRDYLATALVDKLTAAQSTDACPDQLKKPLDEVGATDLDVQRDGVKVTGTTATARVTQDLGSRDVTGTIQLVRQSGRWKVSGL